MRNLCTIVTFHTPIDSIDETEKREDSVMEMIEGYIINSGMDFKKEFLSNETHDTTLYTYNDVVLSISVKKDSEMFNYYSPHFIVEIHMNDLFFQKELIEDFINTITRFFSGKYINEYFMEYDQKLTLENMNVGKKYSIKDVGEINMESLASRENKNLLDSILFLHYTLEKQIYAIGISTAELGKFLQDNNSPEHITNSFLLSGKRMNEVEAVLIKNISIIHKQIEIILSYFLKS